MKQSEELVLALASSDSEQRRHAVESLAEYANELDAPLHVLHALGDEDWRVRKQAIEVAVQLAPSPELLSALVEALMPGENVGLRNAAVEALGAYGQAAIDALASKLAALDADGRKLAAEALARTALPSALEALKPLLADRDPNVRAAALDAIAIVGAAAAAEAFEILSGFLQNSQEEAFVRLCALDGINRLGSLLPWPTVERMLQNPVLERSALAAAGRSAHPEALGALLVAFEGARGGGVSTVLAALVDYCRAFAQNHLILRSEDPSRAVVTRLLALSLPSNEDLTSRKAALIVAGALGLEPIAPIAAEALSDTRLLAEADESLSLLGARAVPALLERARAAEPETRAACIEIVTGLADGKSAPLAALEIRKWMDSGEPVVVRAGLGALTRLGDESCLATVSGWLCNEEASSAAETALAVLSQRFPEPARKIARQARSE
ncbi:MAG TPA: HEAT repeat domain-containing protein, partial [Polyangiaceae bacterium]|nr:HEAT repeat domain-containing protein [Polyangiaceae bacterium]